MIRDTKSKVLLLGFAFLAVISIMVTYYRYVVVRDFDFYTDPEAFNEALLEE